MLKWVRVSGLLLFFVCPLLFAQKGAWRQATAAELAAALPSRASVENERIETEMRTASGIIDGHKRVIAGTVLITAGYSAEGKYSHYLLVQARLNLGGIVLKPGQYVMGWTREERADVLKAHLNEAATGRLIGTIVAKRITDSNRVESLRIWPPDEKSIMQIGRFSIPYKVMEQ